ncbi:MAG TPA: hypothetical protein VF889_00765 [Bacteroidota bacterium]
MRKAPLAGLFALLLAGCATTAVTPRGIEYRVTTGNCQCEQYAAKDPAMPVRYDFAAAYEIDEEFVARIRITIHNDGGQTLTFTDAYVKVDSRNVPFQYNDRFVPFTAEQIGPHEERTIPLVGRAPAKQPDPWLAVAGEEMVVTIKGVKYGSHSLAEQTVTFVPRNPKLQD